MIFPVERKSVALLLFTYCYIFVRGFSIPLASKKKLPPLGIILFVVPDAPLCSIPPTADGNNY